MAVKKTTAPTKTVAAAKSTAKSTAKVVAKPPAKTGAKPAAETAPAAVTKLVRRKEMVARIVASSGLKPNQVKTMLDSVLGEIGKALSAGEGLSLPPLGKITVNRHKEVGNREVLICKLRRKIADAPATGPVTGLAKAPLETAAKEG